MLGQGLGVWPLPGLFQPGSPYPTEQNTLPGNLILEFLPADNIHRTATQCNRRDEYFGGFETSTGASGMPNNLSLILLKTQWVRERPGAAIHRPPQFVR